MSNATPKRLNEIDKPVLDFTMADAQHQLVVPQNTTANLADIPNKTASLAYDTTQATIVVNTGSGFSTVVPVTGVTPGSFTNANITVNAQGQVTAASDGSGGSGAAQDLSNLTNPTNINQALIFGNGISGQLSTADFHTSQSLLLSTGASTGSLVSNPSGSITITTGATARGATGTISIVTGTSGSNNGASGDLILGTGDSNFAPIGNVTIQSGSSPNANSGNISLITGTSGGTQGSVSITALYLGLPIQTTDPSAPAGSVYYNSISNNIRWFNGTAWANLT